MALFDPIEQTQDDVARARERVHESSELLRAANRLDAAAGLDTRGQASAAGSGRTVVIDLTQLEHAD